MIPAFEIGTIRIAVVAAAGRHDAILLVADGFPFQHRAHRSRCDKTVTGLRNRLDQLVAATRQDLAQCRDVDAEIHLVDENPGPNFSHQLVFGREAALTAHQGDEQVEGLGGQPHRISAIQQQPLARHQRKVGKFELLDRGVGHPRRPGNLQAEYRIFAKTERSGTPLLFRPRSR